MSDCLGQEFFVENLVVIQVCNMYVAFYSKPIFTATWQNTELIYSSFIYFQNKMIAIVLDYYYRDEVAIKPRL